MNAQTPTSIETNLIRAFMNTAIQWYADMGYTRMNFVCDATMFDVGALAEKVNPLHQIVLNLSGNATRHFKYDEDQFSFYCGFNGQDVFVEVPYEAVLAMNVEIGEQHMVSLPLPNLERHMLYLAQMQAMREHLEQYPNQDFDGDRAPVLSQEELPSGAQAVQGLEEMVMTHDEEGQVLPKITDLMRRPPLDKRPKPTPEKEAPAPLLDFGNVGGTALPQAKKRRVCPPHLRVIQGGKQ